MSRLPASPPPCESSSSLPPGESGEPERKEAADRIEAPGFGGGDADAGVVLIRLAEGLRGPVEGAGAIAQRRPPRGSSRDASERIPPLGETLNTSTHPGHRGTVLPLREASG